MSDVRRNADGLPVILLAQVARQWSENEEHGGMSQGGDAGVIVLELKVAKLIDFIKPLHAAETDQAFSCRPSWDDYSGRVRLAVLA